MDFDLSRAAGIDPATSRLARKRQILGCCDFIDRTKCRNFTAEEWRQQVRPRAQKNESKRARLRLPARGGEGWFRWRRSAAIRRPGQNRAARRNAAPGSNRAHENRC